MNQNWSEQLMGVINQIAEKLGVAAEQLYPILRKQAMVDGILSVLGVLICIVVFYLLYKAIYICYLKKNERGDNLAYENSWDGLHVVFCMIWGIVAGISIISLFINVNVAINVFINPDWYIINNILSQLIK